MPREPRTGGLHLPKDVGVSESTAKAIESAWSTIQRVDGYLKSVGIHQNEVPDVECPIVTAEALTDPDIKKYTVVFAAQLRWYNYTARLLADIRALILEVKNAMDDIETSKRIEFRKMNEGAPKAEKIDKQEMEDLIAQDPHYRALKLQFQELEQQRIKVDAWSDSLDRNLKTVSRQIENRKTENQGGNREGNMPGHSTGRWAPSGPNQRPWP